MPGFGFGFAPAFALPARMAGGAGPAALPVLDGGGNPFTVALAVLDAGGSDFTVPTAVLDGRGNPLNVS